MNDFTMSTPASIPSLESSRGSLRPEQRRLLDAIWDDYMASPASDWPHAHEFRLRFGRTATLAALEDLPPGIVVTTFPEGRYALTLYGAFLTSKGSGLFRIFVAFLE